MSTLFTFGHMSHLRPAQWLNKKVTVYAIYSLQSTLASWWRKVNLIWHPRLLFVAFDSVGHKVFFSNMKYMLHLSTKVLHLFQYYLFKTKKRFPEKIYFQFAIRSWPGLDVFLFLGEFRLLHRKHLAPDDWKLYEVEWWQIGYYLFDFINIIVHP